MKIAIVYYSLEGNTKLVANLLAEALSADIVSLHPSKEYPTGKMSKFIWGGKSAMFADEPKLEDYAFAEEDYDLIILGTPIWASTFTPPLRTFLKQHPLTHKKIALFACSAGGGTSRCFQKLKEQLSDCTVVGELSLVEPKRDEFNVKQEIEQFANQLKKVL